MQEDKSHDIQPYIDMVYTNHPCLHQYKLGNSEILDVDNTPTFVSNITYAVSRLLKNQLNTLLQQSSIAIEEYPGDYVHKVMVISAHIVSEIINMDRLIGLQAMHMPVDMAYIMQTTMQEVTLKNEQQSWLEWQVVGHPVQAQSHKLSIVSNSIDNVQPLVVSKLIMYTFVDMLTEYAATAPDRSHIHIPTDNFDKLSSEIIKQLEININAQSVKIAVGTSRGVGNVILTSPAGFKVLQQVFVGDYTIEMVDGVCNVLYNNKVRYTVLVSESPVLDGETPKDIKFVVGYRGKTTVDAGVVFAPYTLLIPHIQINQTTFEQELTFSTRFGTYFPKEGTPGAHTYNLLTITCSK
jgi:hypothetical protein